MALITTGSGHPAIVPRAGFKQWPIIRNIRRNGRFEICLKIYAMLIQNGTSTQQSLQQVGSLLSLWPYTDTDFTAEIAHLDRCGRKKDMEVLLDVWIEQQQS